MKKPYFHINGVPWGENYGIFIPAITKLEEALGKTLKKKLLSLGSPLGNYFVEKASYLFWLQIEQFKSIINKIKVVVYFAEEAFTIDPEKIVEASDKISNHYAENYEQLVIAMKKLKKKEKNIELKIRNVLDCYHSLYEQGYKILISFPIIAKDILIHRDELKNKSIENCIYDDPSYKTKKIQSSLIIGGYQTTILLEGYDNHVRNAISHGCIEIPDPDKDEVILKDKDKKTGKEWKKNFNYSELIELTEKIWRTILALELALQIFNANNINIIYKYLKEYNIPPSPRRIRDVLYINFHSMGFDIINIDKDDQFNSIKIRARTRPFLEEADHGPSDLFLFEGNKSHHFRLPPVDFSVNVRENVLRAFEMSENILRWFNKVKIEIIKDRKKIALINCDNPKKFYEKLNNCKDKTEAEKLVADLKLYESK